MKLVFSGMRKHEVVGVFFLLFGAASFFSAAAFWQLKQPLAGSVMTGLGGLLYFISRKIDPS